MLQNKYVAAMPTRCTFLCSELTCTPLTAVAAPNAPVTGAAVALLCTRTTFQTELLLKTYITSPASRLVTREELLPHLRERTGSRNASNAVIIWNQGVFNAYRCIQMHTCAYRCSELTCTPLAAAAAPNAPVIGASVALFCTRTTFQTELLLKTYITSPAFRLVTREELLPHLRGRTGSRNASNVVII